MKPPEPKLCAIYTRKSTEHNLDLAFNSLDAQREACEAYIKSQAHEGWKLVRERYDDGGFSGGSMERPALQKLLEDRKITLHLDAKARDWLAAKGWDPAYGARPLKRVIQKSVQDPLAEMILAGNIKDGESVTVLGDKLGLTFNGKVAQAA